MYILFTSLNEVFSSDLRDRRYRLGRVSKNGSLSTAVWSPGSHTANKIVDLGAGMERLECVESVNALEDFVTVKSRAAHTHLTVYSAEPID